MTITQGSTSTPVNFVRTGPRGGPPIIFIHALGLDLSLWENQIQVLGLDHDVIAIDLPGHGLSGALPATPKPSILADTVATLIADTGAGAADVVGISVGGMIAQTLAISHPHLVRSLTLVATTCTFTPASRQLLRNRAIAVRENGMDSIIPQHLQRWLLEDFRNKRPDILDRFTKILRRQSSQFHADMWDMIANLDLEQALETVSCPALVIAGADDPSAPPAAARVIAARLQHAEVHIMEHCNHFPPIEHPAQFNALLRAFLLRRQG